MSPESSATPEGRPVCVYVASRSLDRSPTDPYVALPRFLSTKCTLIGAWGLPETAGSIPVPCDELVVVESRLVRLPRAAWALLAACWRSRPDFALATVEEKALLLVWFAAVLFRCSYWVVAEDPPFTDRYLPRETGLRRFERMLRKWLLRRLIARSKGVFLFIQRSALDEFLPSGVPVFPLKTGVSDEALKTAASVTPPPATVGAADPLRVAYAGAIDDEQGIPELLEAVARVREALPTIRLVLVGVVLPSYARKFSRMLQLHRLESAVTVTGWLSYERMLEELRACDIGCYLRRPSAWAEAAQPLKVCEYMGATIPTVSWDYPGARTLLGGGQFGKLVPPGDVPAVAAAIRGLATNQERGEMVSRIRASVSELAVGASLERLLAECRKNR